MSRRLIKSLEDLAVYYDHTVRNASACIIQFMYGGDGMDPGQMEEKSGLPLNFERLFMKSKVVASFFFAFVFSEFFFFFFLTSLIDGADLLYSLILCFDRPLVLQWSKRV